MSAFIGRFLELGRRLLPDQEPRVLVDQINEQTIAEAIVRSPRTSFKKRMGGDFSSHDYPFSIVDVMVGIGHLDPSISADYQKKFPKEYGKAREALHRLSRPGGALETKSLGDLINEGWQPKEPVEGAVDSHKESTYYRVTDISKLKDIARR